MIVFNDEWRVRELIHCLWREFDAGGISFRRSYQGWLLEAAMDLLPQALSNCDLGETFLRECENIIRETKISHSSSARQLVLPFEELTVLSDQEMIVILVKELDRWYREEAEKFEFFSSWQKRMCSAIYGMSLVAYGQSCEYVYLNLPINNRNVLDEAADRSRMIHSASERHRMFKEFGISPWLY